MGYMMGLVCIYFACKLNAIAYFHVQTCTIDLILKFIFLSDLFTSVPISIEI